LRKDNRAVSPAISTVIVTSAVVVMVLVAMVYANNFLNVRMAENEFSTNKQFMFTTGLQIDDIAWTLGRTQTVRYSTRFAQVKFEPLVLEYSVEINSNGVWTNLSTTPFQTGIILFNMPTTAYTLSDDYYERIFPSSNSSFLQEGPTAPVSHVYVIEKVPMANGNFTRVTAVPTIRMLSSTIGSQNYVKFYMPLLEGGTNLYLSQSITLTGTDVIQYVRSSVTQVRFTVHFPESDQGFNNEFFRFENDYQFDHYTVTVDLLSDSVVEFYIGTVVVSMGLYV
jgi:hypothetical protein